MGTARTPSGTPPETAPGTAPGTPESAAHGPSTGLLDPFGELLTKLV